MPSLIDLLTDYKLSLDHIEVIDYKGRWLA